MRTQIIGLKLTEQEKELVAERAGAKALNLAAFSRMVLLDYCKNQEESS